MNKITKQIIAEFKKRGIKPISKIIPFTNNDVPIFLKKLDEFEKRSKKSNLLVRIRGMIK